jgi:hypothetical protein
LSKIAFVFRRNNKLMYAFLFYGDFQREKEDIKRSFFALQA